MILGILVFLSEFGQLKGPMNRRLHQNLSDAYYLENFQKLLEFVSSKYRDLLNTEEKKFLKNFQKLGEDASRLFVRLVSRSASSFRVDKLNYGEIDIPKGLKELEDKNFIELGVFEDWYDHDFLFTSPELKGFLKFKKVKGFSSLSKSALMERMEEFSEEFLADFEELIVSLFFHDTIQFFLLLYFGNLEQSLSDFILEDIGVLKWERVTISKKTRYFQTREEAEKKLILLTLQAELWEAREMGEEILPLLKLVEKLQLLGGNISDSVKKIFVINARELERRGDLKNAYKFYSLSLIPPARERMVRVLDKQEKYKKALALCQEIEKDPHDQSEESFVEVFLPKLQKKLGLSIQKKERDQFSTLEIMAKKTGRGVEEDSLKVFEEEGWKGFHLENLLWTSAFGLYFWDIIFTPAKGAFCNPFQRGPRDLFKEGFYLKRKEKIEKRLKEIKDGQWSWEQIEEVFDQKKFTANWMVAWKKVAKKDMKAFFQKVPDEDKAYIFSFMVKDLKCFCSGFPDLFLYKSRKKEYLLAEVKGPGDTLQNSQKRLLKKFEAGNIPYEIVKVKYG